MLEVGGSLAARKEGTWVGMGTVGTRQLCLLLVAHILQNTSCSLTARSRGKEGRRKSKGEKSEAGHRACGKVREVRGTAMV